MRTVKIGCQTFTKSDLERRQFLRVGSLSFLGISLSRYIELKSLMAAEGSSPTGQKAEAQACILLWLEGGPGQVDTWDPKLSSSFRPIATNVVGIRISALLPRVAKQMDKLAIIRSMHTEEQNHAQGTYYVMTGHRPNPAMQFPSFGSIVTKEMGPRGSVPPYVLAPDFELERERFGMGFKAGFLGPEYDPMMLPDPNVCGKRFVACPSKNEYEVTDLTLPKSVSIEGLENRRSFLTVVDELYRQKLKSAEFLKMDTFREQALKMLLTPEVAKAFDLSQEPEKFKEAYGRNGFGQSVLLARRLVEAGSRFVTAAGYSTAAWDTHADNDRIYREDVVPPLDQALSALLEDLEQRGLLESTLIIVMGEFGRTPHLNANNGRDHWPYCWSLALGGGGIRGGQVIGASDEKGAYVADRMVTMGDLFATIYKALGIDWTKEYMTPIGRPVKIANSIEDKTGQPISELI